MHSLYFVLVEKERAKTSKKAQDRASSLLAEHGFSGTNDFGHGKSDWYLVGGRWHNILVLQSPKGEEAQHAVEGMLNANYPGLSSSWRYSSDANPAEEAIRQEAIQKANALFRAYFPNLEYTSGEWNEKFSEANAMLVDEGVIETLKSNYFDRVEVFRPGEGEMMVSDLAINPEEYIGKYWIVAIDYHF